MTTPIDVAVDLSIALLRVADASGLSLSQARRFLRELALRPAAEGDALLAEARRECIRDLAAQRRRSRR